MPRVQFVTFAAHATRDLHCERVRLAYPRRMGKLRAVTATSTVVAVALLLTGCTGDSSEPGPSEAATASDPTPVATPSASSTPVEPSLPAGIPTAEPTQTSNADPAALDATAVITLATSDPSSGGLLVGGYVNGVMEDGGDCQFIVTPTNGEAITVRTVGVENNGSTSCGSTTLDSAQTPAGSYSVALHYVDASGEYQTTSDSIEVTLP